MNLLLSRRACFRRSRICKARADVGVVHRDVLFSSDRTSKESACCFTAETPQGIPTSGRQGLYLFLCQFVFLPSSWHPPLQPPPFPSSWPHTTHTVSESHRSFQPTPVILLSTPETIRSGVWSGESVCHLSSLCPQSDSLVCTLSDHT